MGSGWVLCKRRWHARARRALEEIRITMLRMWGGAPRACATAGPHLYNIIYPKERVTGPSPKWRLQVWAPGGAHGGPETMLRGPRLKWRLQVWAPRGAHRGPLDIYCVNDGARQGPTRYLVCTRWGPARAHSIFIVYTMGPCKGPLDIYCVNDGAPGGGRARARTP